MKERQRLALAMIMAIGVGFGESGLLEAQDQQQLFTKSAELMGVQFRISLYADNEKQADSACNLAFARIAELESKLSNYQDDSELNRLCRSDTPVVVSDDLWFVLKESLFYWELSDGAFDVTIGRVTRLWRRARRLRELPGKARIKEEVQFVGSHYLELNLEKQMVTISKPGLLIDLGAIGKGYAADQALEVLRAQGLPSSVINASGDVLFGDAPPGKKGWPAAVVGLNPEADPLLLELQANCAIATSGSAYQHLEVDGKRYSHIIDPRSGLALEGSSSVSVLAPTGLESDALASAISVLGPKIGSKLVSQLPSTEFFAVCQRNSRKPAVDYRSAGFPLKYKK